MTYDPIHYPLQRESCRMAAFRTLPALRHGDRVRVTNDGKTHDMTVSRTAHRSDGAYGSWESTRVTVTFGPGRYAFDVTAERIAAGQQSIERLADPSMRPDRPGTGDRGDAAVPTVASDLTGRRQVLIYRASDCRYCQRYGRACGRPHPAT